MTSLSSIVFWLSKGRAAILLFVLLTGTAMCGEPAEESTDESAKEPAPMAKSISDLYKSERVPFNRKTTKAATAPDSNQQTPRIDYLIIVVIALALLLWFGLWFFKKFVPGGQQLFATPAMEVLGRTHLDPQRYLALVRVGSRVVMIGTGPDGINQLSEITDEKEVASILETATPKTDAGLSMFQKLFTKQLKKVDEEIEETRTEVAVEELESDMDSLRQRVRDLRDTE